ncbi:hypothetical protein [Raoultella ornithinolytica]|uniref:hypothetical protein n=1 Tax=Raoultella ornithinolytica TaxID=54291 RepID=UPI002A4E247D|nr:hypothetical protein [Raoultella ornithinolytica]
MTTDITELTQKRNAAISQLSGAFEPGHISQREIDALSYTVDVMNKLVEALEHYKSREERVTALVHDNSKSWNELYQQVEAKDKRNAELVEALEAKDADAEWMRKRIAELAKERETKEEQGANWFQMAQKLGEDLDAAEKRIAELESRKPDIYLCRVIRNGEELYSPCGADYPRGAGYHRSAPVESRTVTVKLPRPGFVTISGERMAVYLKADVDAVLAAAGIREDE